MTGKQGSVLHVLLHIFKHHAEDNIYSTQVDASLKSELKEAGFSDASIESALKWLIELVLWKDFNNIQEPTQPSNFRVFNDYEKCLFDDVCRNYILHLENNGILTPLARELVIDRVMALSDEGVDVALIKWVTLMVLFNHPHEEQSRSRVELLALEAVGDAVN